MGLDRISGLLAKGLMIVGGVSLWLLVVLATGNVGMRIFQAPYAGTYELVSFLGALVIAGALAHTQRRKDHIVVDIISEKFPPALKRVLDSLNYLFTCVLFGIVTWQVWVWGNGIRLSGELSETLKLPFHHFIYGVSICFGALTLTLFIDFMRAVLHGTEEEK